MLSGFSVLGRSWRDLRGEIEELIMRTEDLLLKLGVEQSLEKRTF